MTFEEGERDLHENLPNEIFIDGLFLLLALLYELCEITPFAMFHDYIQSCILLIYNLIIAPDNIFMLELTEDVNFIN